jgi:tetratricopeptide (TPR) repeat protein
MAVLVLVALAIGCVGLFMTRDLAVWQSIPGVDRIVNTSLLDAKDVNSQLRLKVWALSWEAFKARPILGWGLENYIVAFQQYYDPDLAIYGALWFDRTHNKLFDVLVMQGVFGLFAYLAIFGAAGVQIITLKKGPKSLLFALLIAYFVQNLFFTDHLISYLFFFAFLGYIYRLSVDENKPNDKSSLSSPLFASKSSNARFSYTLIAITITLVPLLFASLYTWNWVPFSQARFYFGANEKKSVNEMVSTLSGAMTPYNFAQVGIRTSAIDDVYMPQFFYNDPNRMNAQNDALGSVLINGMQDVIHRHPAYEVRYYTRLVEMMNGYARSDATYYAKAEPVIRSAIKLAPRHQELHYHLAFNLAGQGRFDEAIRASQYAVSLSPAVLTSHLKLGFIYEIAGQHGNAQQEIKRMEQIDPALKILSEGDRGTLRYLYQSWGMTEKLAD